MKIQHEVAAMISEGNSMREVAKWLSTNMRGAEDGDKLETLYTLVKHLNQRGRINYESEHNV